MSSTPASSAPFPGLSAEAASALLAALEGERSAPVPARESERDALPVAPAQDPGPDAQP